MGGKGGFKCLGEAERLIDCGPPIKVGQYSSPSCLFLDLSGRFEAQLAFVTEF